MTDHGADKMRRWAKKEAQRARAEICSHSGTENDWYRAKAEREKRLRDYQRREKNGGKAPVTEERLAAILRRRQVKKILTAYSEALREGHADGVHE